MIDFPWISLKSNRQLFKLTSGLFSHIAYAGNDTYTSHSGYMNFASYTVENRERVKVVDGTHGVPISTQVSRYSQIALF